MARRSVAHIHADRNGPRKTAGVLNNVECTKESNLVNRTFSRRRIVQGIGAMGLSISTQRPSFAAHVDGEPKDGPKICVEAGAGRLSGGGLGQRGMRRVKQLGVDYVLMGGPSIPWQESEVRSRIDRLKSGGLSLFNMMISGFPNTLYGRPGRDEEIHKICESIRAAGRAGLPVIEYNFYAHRAIEGYYEEVGRAGAGLTAFDYERVKSLPPLPEEGAHTIEEMWNNVTYFLKAVIPVAERSGVRLALHPNDPPVPLSRGSGQIMGTVEGWKRLIEIVPSPSNGITFDCGVTREMGNDPVEVCRYFGTRDRINHVHYRNVRVRVPYEKYSEVFLDEGQIDMFAVMKELVRQKYSRTLYPEHPRALDADRDLPDFKPYYPGGGSYTGLVYNVGYTKAMLQAASQV
jgi:mannonate dehydratase